MIHALPEPIRGATHADIYEGHEQRGAFFLRWWLGTLDGDGVFIADPVLAPCTRALQAGLERGAFDAFVEDAVVAAGGTHVTGRHRVPDDALAYFDAHNLWDASVETPALDPPEEEEPDTDPEPAPEAV